MCRLFKTVDYEATLDTSVRLGDCLPEHHLARFIVDIVAQLDLAPLYARYGTRGGAPYAPEILLALLFYAYATGTFASRKIEQATKETAAFRYLAGNLSPDHDTIAAFRKTFLPELSGLFVQILLLAQESGFLTLGNISLDGTKMHADASKSRAVSYKRLQQGWQAFFGKAGQALSEGASLKEKRAYTLRTALGKAIYRRRKCTVEPVFGIIKEGMGFRQFSLRGQAAVTGEGCLVCLAFNLRRLHVLQTH